MDEQQEGVARVFRSPADILATAPKVGTDTIHIDEWDTDVRVQGVGKRQHSKIIAEATNPETGEIDNDVVEMAIFRDAVLEPKFSEEEIEALWQTAPKPINTVLRRILELSGTAPGKDPVATAAKTFPQADESAV